MWQPEIYWDYLWDYLASDIHVKCCDRRPSGSFSDSSQKSRYVHGYLPFHSPPKICVPVYLQKCQILVITRRHLDAGWTWVSVLYSVPAPKPMQGSRNVAICNWGWLGLSWSFMKSSKCNLVLWLTSRICQYKGLRVNLVDYKMLWKESQAIKSEINRQGRDYPAP